MKKVITITLLATLYFFNQTVFSVAKAQPKPTVRKDDSGLSYFDPGKPGSDIAAGTRQIVKIDIDRNIKTIRISPKFYGVNVHPLPAKEAFRCPELIRTLRPDTIRIMTLRHTFWYKKNGKSVKEVKLLSPRRGVFNWGEIDALLTGIESFGAEPYVALGFGAPEWLNSAESVRRGRPLRKDIPEYADFMAKIVAHIAEKKNNVRYLTIDNEPENVKYPIDDYVLLYKLASEKIYKAMPGVKIAGPAIGYAKWKQPGGKHMSFFKSLKYLYNSKVKFDALDWHVYSSSPQKIFKTVDLVQKIYGKDIKLFITELNLDWRYSGKGGQKSRQTNTSWNSAAWLARTFDGLQEKGVNRAYFFCLKNNFFGLYDYRISEVRPNYYVFWMFTNLLGRQRIRAVSSHQSVRIIATLDNENKTAVMLYNLSEVPVKVLLPALSFRNPYCYTLSKKWYNQHKKIINGKAELIKSKKIDKNKILIIPARGIVLIKENIKKVKKWQIM